MCIPTCTRLPSTSSIPPYTAPVCRGSHNTNGDGHGLLAAGLVWDACAPLVCCRGFRRRGYCVQARASGSLRRFRPKRVQYMARTRRCAGHHIPRNVALLIQDPGPSLVSKRRTLPRALRPGRLRAPLASPHRTYVRIMSLHPSLLICGLSKLHLAL